MIKQPLFEILVSGQWADKAPAPAPEPDLALGDMPRLQIRGGVDQPDLAGLMDAERTAVIWSQSGGLRTPREIVLLAQRQAMELADLASHAILRAERQLTRWNGVLDRMECKGGWN
jgi:hypothetical protein